MSDSSSGQEAAVAFFSRLQRLVSFGKPAGKQPDDACLPNELPEQRTREVDKSDQSVPSVVDTAVEQQNLLAPEAASPVDSLNIEDASPSRKKQKLSTIVSNQLIGISMEEFESHYMSNRAAHQAKARVIRDISVPLGGPVENSVAEPLPDASVFDDVHASNDQLDRVVTTKADVGSTHSSVAKVNNLLQRHPGWSIVYEDVPPAFSICACLTGPDVFEMFETSQAYSSKRQARVAAAEKALLWCEEHLSAYDKPQISATVSGPSPSGDWISQLHQYVQQRDKQVTFTITTYAIAHQQFGCMITLKGGHSIGGDLVPQPNKAKAKQETCRVALEYLLAQETPPKIITPDCTDLPATSVESETSGGVLSPSDNLSTSSDAKASACNRVHTLCQQLRISPPSYVLSPDPHAPSLWSGYAQLTGPTIAVTFRNSKIATVHEVFGQKNAREELARQALSVLEKSSTELPLGPR